MKLCDFLESGIVLEGYRLIQCWENEDGPTIYYEGYDTDIPEEYMDRQIAYIFPFNTANEAAICIELEVR
jgi:hypothetical protein